MKAFKNHFSYEFLTGLRDRNLLLMNYLFPLGFYMMIGGYFVPTNLLPTILGKIGMLLPSTHAINLFKFYSYNQSIEYNPVWSMIILLLGGILSFVLAIYLFNWDSRNNTRRGHPLFGFIAILPYIIGAAFLP